MLKIRLQRIGRKKAPYYRIVVQATNRPKRSGYIGLLGSYNPFKKTLSLNKEKLQIYLDQGAKLTKTIYFLIKKEEK